MVHADVMIIWPMINLASPELRMSALASSFKSLSGERSSKRVSNMSISNHFYLGWENQFIAIMFILWGKPMRVVVVSNLGEPSRRMMKSFRQYEWHDWTLHILSPIVPMNGFAKIHIHTLSQIMLLPNVHSNVFHMFILIIRSCCAKTFLMAPWAPQFLRGRVARCNSSSSLCLDTSTQRASTRGDSYVVNGG